MVFMGNTQKSVAYMLKHSHFFEPLPDKYIDSAFLDRIHAYNPGWEVAPICHDQFSNGYGFGVDYLAEVLKQLRTEDFTGAYKTYFEITSKLSTRDQTGFEKTFSGLMKILYPDGKATPLEVGKLLSFSMEARRRVREHILRIDDTFTRNDFSYRSLMGDAGITVLTPEEVQYPTFAALKARNTDSRTDEAKRVNEASSQISLPDSAPGASAGLSLPGSARPGHIIVPENTKGWSYRRLFANHLKGARRITVNDPYVRAFCQARNVMELLQMVH
jgi:ATP-dependent Lon protease